MDSFHDPEQLEPSKPVSFILAKVCMIKNFILICYIPADNFPNFPTNLPADLCTDLTADLPANLPADLLADLLAKLPADFNEAES